MKCKSCSKKAVISNYCSDHFIDYFENTVKDTIKQFFLLKKSDKVVVAVSGGKDSLTTLYVLKKLGYKVDGLAIDEGISNYRERTLGDLDKFSKEHNIKINIILFKAEFKYDLDEILKKHKLNPCYVCGVFRRYLLNKYSKKYDVIATGHNLDDEAQAIMMNIAKAQPELLSRLGPVTGLKNSKYFTKRIKPLYLLKDREVKAYTVLKGFRVQYSECPYSFASFRASVQEELNNLEQKQPGVKLNIIQNFLDNQDKIKDKFSTTETVNTCIKCGEPSSGEICKTCEIMETFK